MANLNKRTMAINEGQTEQKPSSAELLRMMRGRSRPARGMPGAPDSVIAVYKDRVTYTFIMGHEVASIHFDACRQEIFFKGRNIRNMELSPNQRSALLAMKKLLASDKQAQRFVSAYCATLDRLLADK